MIGKILAQFPLLAQFQSLVRRPEQQQPLKQAARVRLVKVELLDRCVAVIVPQTVGANAPADTSVYAEQTKRLMTECFGGATIPVARKVSEKRIMVRSYTTSEELDRHLPTLLAFVGTLQQQLGQDEIALEIDGEMLRL